MHSVQSGEQRSPFSRGSDCEVCFIKRADNAGARADVFEIIAADEVFEFQMMKMRRRKEADPWVFGSFKHDRRQIWTFREDIRKQAGFKGDVFTHAHKGQTYALFVDPKKVLQHLVPFVEMLLDPSTDPDSDEYIAQNGDLYDEMSEIAHELGLDLPEDVQELLERDEDEIEETLV